MSTKLQNHDVYRWSNDFLTAVDDVLNDESDLETDLPVQAFVSAFENARQRLLLFDFDGTLAPIVNDPAEARPPVSMIPMLHRLAETSDLVVISGRNRAFLEQTFADIPVHLVAEHGAFLKKPAEPWERLDLSGDDWVEPVRQVMSQFVDRFPGSFIEAKETAIVWHYRRARTEGIDAQAIELATQLRNITSSIPLTVIQGNKVIEVKPAQHSKGTVALSLLEQAPYDFIVSIGDDTTDEDMFRQLPNWAYTIKVGAGVTFARYRLARQREVETLLNLMSEVALSVK